MRYFVPSIRKGDRLQTQHGRRFCDATAVEDSRLALDCFGDIVERVRYRHNPSGRPADVTDWHYCDGAAYCFNVTG
jgi:hypothetical protein